MVAATTPLSVYPDHYDFPPFFTRYPNETTWTAQRTIWASFILDYCRHHRLWRLNVSDALETDLFWNKKLSRRLPPKDATAILEWMAGEGMIGWDGAAAVVYWRSAEEWAEIIYQWIDATGQKGSVLTLYEISEGDLTVSQEFRGIDPLILRKALDVLVKKGTAQVFGSEDERGVKFF
ncbi:ESCRT-II complex subunit-domain-containing protein [Morchella snyderi]|nr:ESCRT-II complex subunit-domain-containing protein [Morchella snyderi]